MQTVPFILYCQEFLKLGNLVFKGFEKRLRNVSHIEHIIKLHFRFMDERSVAHIQHCQRVPQLRILILPAAVTLHDFVLTEPPFEPRKLAFQIAVNFQPLELVHEALNVRDSSLKITYDLFANLRISTKRKRQLRFSQIAGLYIRYFLFHHDTIINPDTSLSCHLNTPPRTVVKVTFQRSYYTTISIKCQ